MKQVKTRLAAGQQGSQTRKAFGGVRQPERNRRWLMGLPG